LPFKHMVTKINLVTIVMVIKKFQLPNLGWLIIFDRPTCNNWNYFIVILGVTEFFQLPFNAMIESFGRQIVLGNKN
jgi:hypothetical protein